VAAAPNEAQTLERATRERDLFLRLLELGTADDVRPFLTEVLSLLLETVHAEHGYLELSGSEGALPLAWVARGYSDAEVPSVRARLSQGIIREAIEHGRTVSTASALEDPRFSGFASVQAGKIRAVLCAPLALASGDGAPGARIGVLYLEGRKAPGPFPEDDRRLVEIASRHAAPFAERLLARGLERVDPTQPLRERLGPAARALAGESAALAEVLRQALVAAPVPVTVLLRGESGTGKSALARALHEASPRARGPFVELNVAALPDTLFESELFGAERGAHSTATQRVIGKAEAANGGTLFLDEIAELTITSQAKLLGFLQSKTFLRLGGTAPVRADVRVIAATNADLEEAVREKRFREDLYYRLNVLEIVMPPLRERRSDIPSIAAALLSRLAGSDAERLALSRPAARALEEAEWPGNIRQLENVISRGWASALAEGARTVEPRHLFGAARANAPDDASGLSYQEATRRFQAELLAGTLEASSWNVSEAARRLGLSRSHMNDLIRAHGLVRRTPSSP
jgi:Nif-specific regulatory protein